MATDQTMRDDFEQAITALEGTQPAEEPKTEALDTAPDMPDTGEDTSSDAPEVEAAPQAEAQAQDGEVQSEAPATEDKPAREKQPNIDRAPGGWTPAEREHWGSLPENVRARIKRRETEIATALQQSAESRKTGEAFNEIVNRYAQVIAAEGVNDPLKGFEGLMQVMTTLRFGSPQQKLDRLIGFIQTYQVPVDALQATLAQVTGRAPAQETQQDANGQDIPPHLQQMLDQRLAPVNQLMQRIQQAEQRQQQTVRENANTEVAQFAQGHEFFQDVRSDMADLVEQAGRRGISMSMEEAYNKACALNPEIQAVLAQRAEQERLTNQAQTIEAKRAAASSVVGQGGAQGGSSTEDLRGLLAEAWDTQTG